LKVFEAVKTQSAHELKDVTVAQSLFTVLVFMYLVGSVWYSQHFFTKTEIFAIKVTLCLKLILTWKKSAQPKWSPIASKRKTTHSKKSGWQLWEAQTKTCTAEF
jgi:hypothetical protein